VGRVLARPTKCRKQRLVGLVALGPPYTPQENCKVLTQRGQVHVFGQTFLGKMSFLAEKWTSPRTLQFSCYAPSGTIFFGADSLF
jgi:hypothetical protein